MSSGMKALLVVAGLLAFFAVPIIGSPLGRALDFLAQGALGSNAETAVAMGKLRGYQGTDLAAALACCKGCDLDWNFNQDRCTLPGRTEVSCYETCATPAPVERLEDLIYHGHGSH